MKPAALSSLDEIQPLLKASGLQIADLSAAPALFFGIHVAGELVACIGLELYDSVALLRSLAVSPAFRGRGLARELVVFAEDLAFSRGVRTLFLLTTSAEAFFTALGYRPAAREEAPAAIRATAQFSGLCPAASAFLSRALVAPATGQ